MQGRWGTAERGWMRRQVAGVVAGADGFMAAFTQTDLRSARYKFKHNKFRQFTFTTP